MTVNLHQHEHHVNVEELFRQHGVHYTKPRRITWEFFSGHPQGHSIGDAVSALKPQGIGQATVYRTIELFLQLGLLSCVHGAAGDNFYIAVCPGHSHALICSKCHSVVEFDDCDISLLEKLLTAKTGFTIQGHHLEIFGTCPECEVIKL
ncbi:MAG: Fur family transcriptional regulator [bacterium]